tara:strand:- start:5050 stop:5232 length:183 start_codon:yes stop_codon:yes gene_type:complete
MMHTNLVAYYERLFAFKQYHGWSVHEIEELMPWEIDVMTSFINNLMEAKELARKQASANR